jgi:uncharacterized protein YndB with AHSA1/START domain
MTGSVQVTRVIPAQADRVWKTLTSRAGMKAYMMGADVETDWEVGHPITMSGEFKGKSYRDTGEVRSFEPEKRLSYTHRTGGDPKTEHLVTVAIEPMSEGTEVTIVQTPAEPDHKAEYEKTWAMMLEKLETAVRAS